MCSEAGEMVPVWSVLAVKAKGQGRVGAEQPQRGSTGAKRAELPGSLDDDDSGGSDRQRARLRV